MENNETLAADRKKLINPIIAAVFFTAVLVGLLIYFGRSDPELAGKAAAAAELLAIIAFFGLNLGLMILFLIGITAVDNVKAEVSVRLSAADTKIREASPKIDEALNSALEPMIKIISGKAGIKAALAKIFNN